MKYKFLVLILWSVACWACKSKKAASPDDGGETAAHFIARFPAVSLPFRVADTGLLRKKADSLRIGYKAFTRFVPDSVTAADFGKNGRPEVYPLGRVTEDGGVTYLFAEAVHGSRRVAYLLCFDGKQHYFNAMPLVRTGFTNHSHAFGQLDNQYTITTYYESRARNGRESHQRKVYVFDEKSREFTLILSEPSEEVIQRIINPIDTLPRKHRFSGDYVKNSRNFIAVRDARKPSEFWFFVHFEKDGGNCTGELKGLAHMTGSTVALFRESGNPCAIRFSFSSHAVSMKEVGGCGNYRGIRCFFEGWFPRKKTPAHKGNKKK